ncbi:MAG: hypothetical protein AAFX08_08605 [Pseudomonadota bacterium]
MRGAVVRFAIGAVAALTFAASAEAGEEASCAAQYTLEEQLMLEWAGLAGDPHAQFALAQCAMPEGADELDPAAMRYALKWVTLAACDATGTDDIGARDRRSRKLKAQGDISFRRFHEIEADESLSRKERRFVEYRDHKTKELMARLKRLKRMASSTDFDAARADVADEFARFGARGRVRLASLASCEYLDAPAPFVAAAWAGAADAWDRERARFAGVYGASERDGWSFREEAERRAADLSPAQLAQFEYQRSELDRYDPIYLARLEEEAALGRLGELRTLQTVEFATAGANQALADDRDLLLAAAGLSSSDAAPDAEARDRPGGFTGPSVTVATQYALEALGFMEFVNGPDNDYGPSTIAAVARAQESEGRAATRWLSHAEVRDMVCRAATEAEDPVSYFNVSMMYLRGQGYPQHLAKARYAMDQADALIEVKLIDPDTLPKWKAEQYPAVRAEIQAARDELGAAWKRLPAATKAKMSAWRPGSEPLCN